MNNRSKNKFTVDDGLLLIGAGLFCVGVAMAWLPGGLMAAGVLCIAYVLIGGGAK